ncbi:unnamed protein product [Caenorhabditis auriculariae]|uniref:alpha-1,2-Mannosidase n=1 Tax=Caenorhabditis auriculariae TaxID=2777116 RepID=A0A8S1HTA1_9PELO|nr:unnamed protein product [Caenorhabditis auriculariae]
MLRWFTILLLYSILCEAYHEQFLKRQGLGTSRKRYNGYFTESDMARYRDKVKNMFYHAYNGYLAHGYPLDELKPISCTGQDTWGSFSLSLVDALDTLLVMGNTTEFMRAIDLVLKSVRDDVNVNVSVFETNIRVVGGLISAHMLVGKVPGLEEEMPGWPCDGPLLRLAVKMADRLLPAFNTDTGMPYGTVNLRYGVHKDETPVTCTAGVGTFIVEFGALSRLTGDDKYERVALRALDALWSVKSPIGLVGNHINVINSQWTATDSGIGAGVDSYFEYLVKGALLFHRPSLMKQFDDFLLSINKHVRKGNWFMWVSMTKGTVSMPIFQSLEAFWPGLLTLAGQVEDAQRIMLQYAKVIRQYGFPPEFYHIHNAEPVEKREAYPLRPEMAESLMYLYRTTGDSKWLELGAEMIDAIETSAKTKCGYATINNVKDHSIEDRMESFFLAETTKYLYLLFDPDNFIHSDGKNARVLTTKDNITCSIYSGGYIFNTEAHPIDPGMLRCCSSTSKKQRKTVRNWEDGVDFLNIIRNQKMGTGHVIKKEDVEEDLRNEKNRPGKGGEEYFTKQYGHSGLEFEIDESLKKESKTSKMKNETREQEISLEMIRELLIRARVKDEEKRERGAKAEGTQKLLTQLKSMHKELTEVVLRADYEAEQFIAKEKRFLELSTLVAAIPAPEAVCSSCSFPMNEKVDDVCLRLFLGAIHEFHLYPQANIKFVKGPVCWKEEEPRIEDNYKNEPPELDKRDLEEDLDFLSFDPVDIKHLGYARLRAPGRGRFYSQFTGGGQVPLYRDM